MSNVTTDIDRFAVSLVSILKDPVIACNDWVPKAVQRTGSSTVKKLKTNLTLSIGRHEWSAEYRNGFSAHTEKNGNLSNTEIGNKAKPGLVHLLENGHATPTGRRTEAFKHMEPALESAEKELYDRVIRAVDRAIGG